VPGEERVNSVLGPDVSADDGAAQTTGWLKGVFIHHAGTSARARTGAGRAPAWR
jgi:hypothetical protein